MVSNPRSMLPPLPLSRVRSLFAAALVAIGACNVDPPPADTGGVNVEPTACGRGLVIVSTDYQSTNISATDTEGQLLSRTVLSSGSEAPGLSVALSGDVVVPTASVVGNALVLIDRYPAAVLTFVDVRTGKVQDQLSVGTGFASNPQDFLALDARRGLVSRYAQNPNPGAEPFDAGSDILEIDLENMRIEGRVDLTDVVGPGDLQPRPSRMVRIGDDVWVLLTVYSQGFESGDGRLVRLHATTLERMAVVELTGLHSCTGLAVSPSQERLAVSCSGDFGGGSVPDPETAGVAVIETTTEELRFRIGASMIDNRIPGFSLAFVDDETLLLPTFGREAERGVSAEPDQLLSMSIDGSNVSVLAEEGAFTIGEVRCNSACASCFSASAQDGGALVRWAIADDGLQPDEIIDIAPEIGLPPRYVGGF